MYAKKEFEPAVHEVVSVESYQELKKEYDLTWEKLTKIHKMLRDAEEMDYSRKDIIRNIRLAINGGPYLPEEPQPFTTQGLIDFMNAAMKHVGKAPAPAAAGFSRHVRKPEATEKCASRHDDLCNACKEACGQKPVKGRVLSLDDLLKVTPVEMHDFLRETVADIGDDIGIVIAEV